MTDEELQNWWPALGTLVTELRRLGQPGVADALVDAVRGGATSGEILDRTGCVLRDHKTLRSQLAEAGVNAWDAVMTEVKRAYPGADLGHWLARFTKRPTRRADG